MFSGCMIGGAIYGTGRRFDVLTPHERVTAMEVGIPTCPLHTHLTRDE